MARGVSLDDAARMALSMPGATEVLKWRNRTWQVEGETFAWERPLSKADLKRLAGAKPPEGPIFAVKVRDQGEKDALLQAHPDAFFTIHHFDGYPAILIRLPAVTRRLLQDAIEDGWLAVAPAPVRETYLAKS